MACGTPERSRTAVPDWPSLAGVRSGASRCREQGNRSWEDGLPHLPGLARSFRVAVRHGHLTIRGQIPLPAVRRGLRLHPDSDDAYAFRINLPGFGSGTSPVVFGRDPGGRVTAMHLGVQPLSFQKRPDALNPRPWVAGALAAAAIAFAAGHRHRAHRAVSITGGRA